MISTEGDIFDHIKSQPVSPSNRRGKSELIFNVYCSGGGTSYIFEGCHQACRRWEGGKKEKQAYLLCILGAYEHWLSDCLRCQRANGKMSGNSVASPFALTSRWRRLTLSHGGLIKHSGPLRPQGTADTTTQTRLFHAMKYM